MAADDSTVEKKHTPGPWPKDHVYSAIRHIVRNVEHDTYCMDEKCEFMWNRDQDFNLIAAAPDLLAALRECSEALTTDAAISKRKELLEWADKAIAKAEGKE